MSGPLQSTIDRACNAIGHDATRLLEVLHAVQRQHRCVSEQAIEMIADALRIPRIQVDGVVSFYRFFSREPVGRIVIRLANDVISKLKGVDAVAKAMSDELGIACGETSGDGLFSLEWTSCIGMSDQAPAALFNDVVVTGLTPQRAVGALQQLKAIPDPSQLVKQPGDGQNAHPLVRSMVRNNLHVACPRSLVVRTSPRGEAIGKAVAMSPAEVIRVIKTARLRGRGGAGFPCGAKWGFARATDAPRKIVVCNADEGEPGTFKDRVLLTEFAERIFAGMTIAAYAIGAAEGLMYLRAEYAYLKAYLEHVLTTLRNDGWLGRDIAGKAGFHFDIRIMLGAGAYVCGEETALISSAEGARGEPKNRPPFPAQQGLFACPTVVNNCETLCCATHILEQGPATFSALGTPASSGTKLLSVSGDCASPGVYEFEWGVTLREILERVGAADSQAVQLGGPSGQLVGPAHYDRCICFDDLNVGGSLMCFDSSRDLLEIVHGFMQFFVDESCGYCTPCRVGNSVLLRGVERLMDGRGQPDDLAQFEQLGSMMKACSRCGLGQTSFRPVTTSLKHFPALYESRVKTSPQGYRRGFDLTQAAQHARQIRDRTQAQQQAVAAARADPNSVEEPGSDG